jgi:hypothetical protein
MIRLLVKEDDVLSTQFALAACVFHFSHPKTLLANRTDGWHCSLRPTTVGETKPEPVGAEY